MLQCRMDRRVAVIVNARAAGANDATIAAIRGCAGPRLTVDVTSSIEEARAIVIRHVRAGVDVGLVTLSDAAGCIREAASEPFKRGGMSYSFS